MANIDCRTRVEAAAAARSPALSNRAFQSDDHLGCFAPPVARR
jgi:hypothetical protein